MKRPLKCPCCENRRLLDVRAVTKTETAIADEKHEKFDYYIKCWKCGKEIGIRKIYK